jgi:hypothetical protein
MSATPLITTLDQEVLALLRGASLECLVCGEFVLRLPEGSMFCPECGCGLGDSIAAEPAIWPGAVSSSS